MNYLMGAAAVLVAAIVIVLALASRKPDEFVVRRSTTIDATPEAIFPHINDLHQWEDWSPYLKKDPAMKGTYSGPVSGIGSVYEFEGNREVGKGRVRITGSRPHSTVAMQLDMIEPFAARNAVEFTLKPDGNATQVTWSMTGKNNFLSKIVGVFLDMDKMIGRDFDAGLADLKTILER
ncbi:MAG: SRPBCC family protein [Gammaproteobacteria bacterium]